MSQGMQGRHGQLFYPSFSSSALSFPSDAGVEKLWAEVEISFLDGALWKLLSHAWLFGTPWTIQSVEFSRPEYWSG